MTIMTERKSCSWKNGSAEIMTKSLISIIMDSNSQRMKAGSRCGDVHKRLALSDILITLDQGSNTAVSFAQIGTTDPMMIVPVTNEDILYTTIYDQYGGYGENNYYEMIISQVKPPVEWNRIEDDDIGNNNTLRRRRCRTR